MVGSRKPIRAMECHICAMLVLLLRQSRPFESLLEIAYILAYIGVKAPDFTGLHIESVSYRFCVDYLCAPIPISIKMGLSNRSAPLVIATIFLLCLSFVIVSLRCWVRISMRRFGLDDWLMSFGLARLSCHILKLIIYGTL